MWPLLNCFPYEDRDRRGKGDGVMPRLFQAMVINELKPQNTSAASFSSAHFSPSSFILFLHAFPPPSFIPIQGPLVYLSGVLRTFFYKDSRFSASLAVGGPSGVTPDCGSLLSHLRQGKKLACSLFLI